MKKLPIVLLAFAGVVLLFGQSIPPGNAVNVSSISSSGTGNITGTVVSGNLVKGTGSSSIGDVATGANVVTDAANDINSTNGYQTAGYTPATVDLGNLTGTINIDWSTLRNGGLAKGVLTGNTTFTFSNGADGKFITVDVAQTGANTFTVTWPLMKWPAGTAPTMTTGAAASDATTIYDLGGTFKGSSIQNLK